MGHLINPLGFRLIFFKNWKLNYYNHYNNLFQIFFYGLLSYIQYNKLFVFLREYKVLYSKFDVKVFNKVLLLSFKCLIVDISIFFPKRCVNFKKLYFFWKKLNARFLKIFKRYRVFYWYYLKLFFKFLLLKKVKKTYLVYFFDLVLRIIGKYSFNNFWRMSHNVFFTNRLIELIFVSIVSFLKNYYNFFFRAVFSSFYKDVSKMFSVEIFKNVIEINFDFFTKRYIYNAKTLLTSFYLRYLRKKKSMSLFIAIRPFINFLNRLLRKNKILGYKFVVKGRFSKRERGSKLKFKGGVTSVSTISNFVDYETKILITKYGVTNLKFWLFLEK